MVEGTLEALGSVRLLLGFSSVLEEGTTVIPVDKLDDGNEGDVDGMGELVLYLASGLTRSKALFDSIFLLPESISDFSGVVFLL